MIWIPSVLVTVGFGTQAECTAKKRSATVIASAVRVGQSARSIAWELAMPRALMCRRCRHKSYMERDDLAFGFCDSIGEIRCIEETTVYRTLLFDLSAPVCIAMGGLVESTTFTHQIQNACCLWIRACG